MNIDWDANNKSDIKHDIGLEPPESPEYCDVSAIPNNPRLIRPIQRLMK
jgi:hypothetical protein